jgi:hypothetical protein
MLSGCSTVPPNANAGGGLNHTPGEPFVNNICFRCTLNACSIPLRSCAREPVCSRWFDCVAVCPTDESGVAAEASCLQKCGLPVSANVLFECIQDFANGGLLGCVDACTPPPDED